MNPGTTLGPYRVDSLIGAGGMGEVYLGVDTRLDRQVAIKVLAGVLASDPGLRERFEREARTISSLSHPNICTLFDLGRHDESDYLVMEYLQGETLADRIQRGPLPPAQVIRIGIEIASALEAAHRQGIVHRDLKPGNVMLTKSGVKLLDFGLAKLSVAGDASGAAFAAHVPTMMPTEQKPLTEQGVILGTFQYMAPEQVEGKQADARSDIFSLGAVLYEMATGKRAFQGTNRASLIAAIMDREPPPMSETQPLTPMALERVVRACLAKDPDERIQTAHDVALQLKWISEASSVIEPQALRRRKKLAPWIVAGVLGAAAVASAGMWWRERTKPPAPYTFSIVAPAGYQLVSDCPSPDGKAIALTVSNRETGARSLWVQRLDDGSRRQLADKVTSQTPFWSPDGQWIGFILEPDRLMRVRVEGGQPELICRSAVHGRSAWSDDGTIVFNTGFGTSLARVPATGGEPVRLTTLDPAKQESYHGDPRFLPGGKRFLFIVHTVAEKRNEIRAGSLDGSKPVTILAADALVGYSEPWLLFVRDGGIYAQRFEADDLRLEGEPRRVVDNAYFAETEATAAAFLARDGALTWTAFRQIPVEVNAYDRNGTVSRTIWKGNNFSNADLSADGQTMVISQWDPAKGATDVHVVDLQRGISTKMTSGLAAYMAPMLSPDGSSIAFFSDRAGMYDIYLQVTDGTARDRVLWKDGRDKFISSWHPDGRSLFSGRFDRETRSDIWIVPVDPPGKPQSWLATEHSETNAVPSPDGKWVAYESTQSGDEELYIRPLVSGRAIRISTEGGGRAAWRADGRELVWMTNALKVMSVDIDLTGPQPRIGKPQQLFTLPQAWDGKLTYTGDGLIAATIRGSQAEADLPIEYSTAWRRKLEQ